MQEHSTIWLAFATRPRLKSWTWNMHVVLTLYNSKTFLVYWSGFPLPSKPMFMWILIWSIIYIWWRNSWRTTIQKRLPLTWSYIFIIYRWAINFFCMIALWFQSCTGSIGIGFILTIFCRDSDKCCPCQLSSSILHPNVFPDNEFNDIY